MPPRAPSASDLVSVPGSRTSARLVMKNPPALRTVATYRLTIFGTLVTAPNVGLAGDDGQLLDGTYSGQPGSNFTLDFNVK